jgi:hypothetical protein
MSLRDNAAAHRRLGSDPSSCLPAASLSSRNIKYLYDGDCSMCLSLVSMLRRQDAGEGRIKFVNIASMAYDPAENEGILYEEAMEVGSCCALSLHSCWLLPARGVGAAQGGGRVGFMACLALPGQSCRWAAPPGSACRTLYVAEPSFVGPLTLAADHSCHPA